MTTTADYAGSKPARQAVGLPGHCDRCALVGHVKAHPDLGCGDVGCDSAHGDETPDYMQSVETYWRDIVCDPDGSLNLDKVARELADALTLQEHLTETYSAVSKGRVSKPFTLPSVVIEMHEEACSEEADEAVADLIEEIGDDDDALQRTPQEVAAWIRELRPESAAIVTQRAAERAEAGQS